jgi:hypothetical protein
VKVNVQRGQYRDARSNSLEQSRAEHFAFWIVTFKHAMLLDERNPMSEAKVNYFDGVKDLSTIRVFHFDPISNWNRIRDE